MSKIQRRKSAEDPPLASPPKKPTHNRIVYERRSLAMTPDQWEALERLAEAMGTIARGGPKRGQPSWRNLIAQLANEAPQIIKNDLEWEEEKKKLKESFKEQRQLTSLIVRAGDIKV